MHNKFSALCGKSYRSFKSSLSIYNTFGSINRARGKTAAVLAGLFVFANSITFAASPSIDVTIMDGDKTIKTVSNYYTVNDILKENDIKVSKSDIISPDLGTVVADDQVIVVNRVNSSNAGAVKKNSSPSDMLMDLFGHGDFSLNSINKSDKPMYSLLEEHSGADIKKL